MGPERRIEVVRTFRSLALIVGLGLIWAGCGEAPPTPTATPSPILSATPSPQENPPGAPGAQQGVESMTISAKGQSPWSLKAERIQYDDNTRQARARKVTWTLLDEKDRALLEVWGEAAVVNTETQGLSFEGPVHAKGSKGEEITCKKLLWDSQARKLRGSQGVEVRRQGTVMTGERLTASPDLKQVEVEGNVRIYFNSGEEQKG